MSKISNKLAPVGEDDKRYGYSRQGGGLCQSCGKSAEEKKALMNCGRCKVTLYCSIECQKKDWKTHKLRCFNETKQDDKLRSEGRGHTPLELLQWSRHWSRPLVDATCQALRVYDRKGRVERLNENFALIRVRFVPDETDPSKMFKLVDVESIRKDQPSPHGGPTSLYLENFEEHDQHLAAVLARGQGDCVIRGIITSSPIADHLAGFNHVAKDVHWKAHLKDVLDGGIQW